MEQLASPPSRAAGRLLRDRANVEGDRGGGVLIIEAARLRSGLAIHYFDALRYVRWAREVAHGLRGINQKLEQQFDQAAAAAERSFRPA
jgi:hypothetical protein